MDLDQLMDRTLTFLRTYAHLDNGDREITFEDKYPTRMPPQLVRQWQISDPGFVPPTHGCKVFTAYNSMQTLESRGVWYPKQFLDDWIQDSEEFVVIDLAAGFGKWLWETSQENPNAHFFLVDRLSDGMIAEEQHRTKAFKTETPEEEGAPWMNSLLRANGYHNITYVDYTLSLNPDMSDFAAIAKDRHVLVSGMRAPTNVSIAVANAALDVGAERCIITPSALENMEDDYARDYLGDVPLSEDELKVFMQRVYDPTPSSEGKKIDYQNPGHERMGIALKQVFAIQLARRLQEKYNIAIHLLPSESQNGYNQPNHVITGVK